MAVGEIDRLKADNIADSSLDDLSKEWNLEPDKDQ